MLISTVVSVLVMLLLGSGIAAWVYSATRPQPFISLTSRYVLGSTPIGATDTTFKVSGQNFPAHAKITFLLDGAGAPGSIAGQSDSYGTVTSQLSVTAAWPTGKHTLAAKDIASVATTKGVSLLIVAPGQDKTPGPHGAPTDSASGTITVTMNNPGFDVASGGEMIWTMIGPPTKMNLVIKGTSNGGSVCGSEDDGKKHSHTHPAYQGYPAYVETSSATCSGTYRGGHLTYTETFTSYQLKDSLGSVCSPKHSMLGNHLEGSFGSPASLTGFFWKDLYTLRCIPAKGDPMFDMVQFPQIVEVDISPGGLERTPWTGLATMEASTAPATPHVTATVQTGRYFLDPSGPAILVVDAGSATPIADQVTAPKIELTLQDGWDYGFHQEAGAKQQRHPTGHGSVGRVKPRLR